MIPAASASNTLPFSPFCNKTLVFLGRGGSPTTPLKPVNMSLTELEEPTSEYKGLSDLDRHLVAFDPLFSLPFHYSLFVCLHIAIVITENLVGSGILEVIIDRYPHLRKGDLRLRVFSECYLSRLALDEDHHCL